MKKKNFIIALGLSCTLAISPISVFANDIPDSNGLSLEENAMNVQAAGTTDTNTDSTMPEWTEPDAPIDLSNKEVVGLSIEVMKEAVGAGKQVTLSEIVGEMTNTEISTKLNDNLKLQLPEGFDTGFLNLQFDSTANKLNKDFTTGMNNNKSADCLQLFNNTYGDLYNSLKPETPTLPEGWNASNMLASGSNAINNAYQNAMASDSFMQMKNSISMGDVFSKASNGLSGYSLESADTLKAMTSSANAANRQSTFGQYQATRNMNSSTFDQWSENQARAVSQGLMQTTKWDGLLHSDGSVHLQNSKKIYDTIQEYIETDQHTNEHTTYNHNRIENTFLNPHKQNVQNQMDFAQGLADVLSFCGVMNPATVEYIKAATDQMNNEVQGLHIP